jgi:hypothetical protein
MQGPGTQIVEAALALASHLRGNGGLELDVQIKEDLSGSTHILKYGKRIYSGTGADPIDSAVELINNIIEVEHLGGENGRHKKCHVCRVLIETSRRAAIMGAMMMRSLKMIGAVQGEAEEDGKKEKGKKEERPKDTSHLN